MAEEKPIEATETTEAIEADSTPKSGLTISGALRKFYGVGDFGFTLMTNVETYYFVFFLTNMALFDPATAALVSGVGSTVDAILGWMYGGFINMLKPMKWGRYRSWLVVLPWIVPILFCLEFTRLSENTALAAGLIIFFNVTSHAAWDFPYVANVTMIAVASKTPEDRAQLASTRSMYANASKIVFSYLLPPVALVGATLLGETNQYAFCAFVFGAVMASLYFVHFKMFKGYDKEYTKEELANYKNTKKTDEGRTTFMDLMRTLFTNPPLMALILSDTAKWIFNFTCAGIAVYYFTYVVFRPELLATYILISNILCVVGAYFAPHFTRLFKSGKMCTVIVFLAMAVVMFAARFMVYSPWPVIILMSIAQFFYGVVYAVTPTLYAETVIYAQWKTGKNAAGWISGLQVFPLKIGFVVRGIAIPAILAAAGFVAGLDPSLSDAALQAGICNGFIVIPAVVLIVAAIILLFGYRLTPAKIQEYQNEIEARAAEKTE